MKEPLIHGLFRKQHRQQLDGSSGYKWNGSCQTGADPARRKTDRRQKRKITGSCDRWHSSPAQTKKGIQFTPQEMSLILDILKEGRPAKEQEQIDQMVQMVRTHMKNHT